MKNAVQQLKRHDALLLLFCSMLFGLAYGLAHERGLVPVPGWYSLNLHRFCFLLMAWTALMHPDPVQKLIWSLTDFAALTVHYFGGTVFVPHLSLPELVDYFIALGQIGAAATFGVAVTQGGYSLLPGWRTEPTGARVQGSTASVADSVAGAAPPGPPSCAPMA